jgi:hypothetical protein
MRTDGWVQTIDRARDGHHPGYDTIKILTNFINEKLNEQL